MDSVVGSFFTWSFPELETSPSNCGIASYEFTDDAGSTFLDVATLLSRYRITYPAVGCTTTPCRSIDVNLEVAQVLTLQIKGTVNGGASLLSDPFSIYICSIESGIGLANKVVTRNDPPNAWWRFNSFTVKPTECPNTLTYELVDGDGSLNL
jgi:hypothetical protein